MKSMNEWWDTWGCTSEIEIVEILEFLGMHARLDGGGEAVVARFRGVKNLGVLEIYSPRVLGVREGC
jgi:hypothetical protein